MPSGRGPVLRARAGQAAAPLSADPRKGRVFLVGAALLAALLVSSSSVLAQERAGASGDDRERRFVDSLRQEDPALAQQYVALRDAQVKAVAELRRAESQFAAVGSELQAVFLPRLKQARRTYAQTSLALLDFVDARDRRTLATYQTQISRINSLLEEHKRTRAELEKLLREN